MFILTWTFDTFAYLIGKQWNHVSVSPKISWVGFVGGLIFTLLATYLAKDFFQFNYQDFNPYVVAAFLPFTATFGDFLESHFKRQAGVKDSGNFIPGHGGMLDRMDAFMITIPALYIYINIFCIWFDFIKKEKYYQDYNYITFRTNFITQIITEVQWIVNLILGVSIDYFDFTIFQKPKKTSNNW